MRKLFVIMIMLSLLVSSAEAQKNIVYFRYSPADGNSAVVLRQLDEIWNLGNSVLFMSYGEKTLVATSDDDFRDLKINIASMQSDFPYSGQTELEFFDSCFVSMFAETVSSKLSITSPYDHGSQCIFILSENMYDNISDTEYLQEIIAVNNLDTRMDVVVYTYNDLNVVKKNGFKNSGKIKYLKK